MGIEILGVLWALPGIEERPGVDFMPELDPGDSQDLEASVGEARSP
ncbi:hypothetical protein J2X04_000175 [Lysobacter niabensis]|uniref:Uncharacterized protein n=1 Tax=Agrilutibacter niabensis TaxID=380628 RepID=A0ABU1VKW4_9GAMM|nr:hypothetical protein [Lysobacter niabensis]